MELGLQRDHLLGAHRLRVAGHQGYSWNHERTWRVYCQLRLNLLRRTKRRVPQREHNPLWVEPV